MTSKIYSSLIPAYAGNYGSLDSIVEVETRHMKPAYSERIAYAIDSVKEYIQNLLLNLYTRKATQKKQEKHNSGNSGQSKNFKNNHDRERRKKLDEKRQAKENRMHNPSGNSDYASKNPSENPKSPFYEKPKPKYEPPVNNQNRKSRFEEFLSRYGL